MLHGIQHHTSPHVNLRRRPRSAMLGSRAFHHSAGWRHAMNKQNLRLALALLVLVLTALQDVRAETGKPHVDIPRVAEPPRIDEFLALEPGADAPGGMARISGFIQQTPSDGSSATRSTDVFLGYDDRTFYAVFIATDEAPERVRARMAPRENLGADDFVTLMLDTDHDRRRAYTFRSNPRGVQWDALWTEGQGFDTSFDAVWGSEARLTRTGYIVSFAIPFRSLRFPTEGEFYHDPRVWRGPAHSRDGREAVDCPGRLPDLVLPVGLR